MKNNIMLNEEKTTYNSFEKIKHISENGKEFWYARELMSALDYSK